MVGSEPRPTPRFIDLLAIVGLWCLAILQPLLDLVGDNAPFLLHHRVDGIDLAMWVAVMALGPPLLLWTLVEAGEYWLGEGFRSRARGAILGALVVVLALGILRKLGDPLPPWLLLPLLISALWLAVSLIRSAPGLRRFLVFLALALPITVALFWSSPGAKAARATAERESGATFLPEAPAPADDAARDAPPVVLVVFDELPLVSILDADLGIDADLCPNLAALLESATWFRNAHTVWPWTNPSIVSMLIGREAERRVPPTRASYPENLLTWLEPTHEVRAFELLTAMAPPGAVELLPRASRTARLRGLALDSAVVVAHQLLPPGLGAWLPPIGSRWGDFWSGRVVRGRGDPDAEPIESTPWAFALADARGRQFDVFLRSIEEGQRPGLYFAHVMLPHMPYRYLPSGQVYGGRPVYEHRSTVWRENEWFALETYQRHLLQVGFVDHLVGRLVERLKSIGLWDRTLVILTSDHGASHWPGQDRRAPHETEHPDDILRVPLFVKIPGQSVGGIDDRAAPSVDVLPTVAAVLGRTIPWSTSGRSLLGEPREVVARRFGDPARGEMVFPGGFAPDRESLARKLELFDPASGEVRWVRFGPYRELIGRKVGDLTRTGSAEGPGCSAVLDQLAVLESFAPDSAYSPALLTGEVNCTADLPVGSFVLAAANGRVAGSGALQQVAGERGLFAVMTAEALWIEGANDVQLYLAWGAPQEPHFEPIESTRAEP